MTGAVDEETDWINEPRRITLNAKSEGAKTYPVSAFEKVKLKSLQFILIVLFLFMTHASSTAVYPLKVIIIVI